MTMQTQLQIKEYCWHISLNLMCPVLSCKPAYKIKDSFKVERKEDKQREPREPKKIVMRGERQADKDMERIRNAIKSRLLDGNQDKTSSHIYSLMLENNELSYSTGIAMTRNLFYQNIRLVRIELGLNSNALRKKTREILELFDSGKTRSEILQMVDICDSNIRRILIREGRLEKRQYSAIEGLTKSQIVIDQYKSGAKLDQIMYRAASSEKYVRSVLFDNGFISKNNDSINEGVNNGISK